VGSALRSQYNFGEGRIKIISPWEAGKCFRIEAFQMTKLGWYLALVKG